MTGRTTSSGRRRATFALTACVLWLLGVEVLPNLHLASHEADHTHEASGTIVRVSFTSTHAHADGTVHRDHDDRASHDGHPGKRRATSDQLAIDVPDGHAASGIAHHALALHQPPPPVVDPTPLQQPLIFVDRQPNERVAIPHAAPPSARGPPAHA